jgi:hypothetical protein
MPKKGHVADIVGIPATEVTREGYSNVPYHRTEYVPRQTTGFFQLDLAQLRGYGLPEEAMKLLMLLSLWKVRRFLDSNMRLRTACELEVVDADGIQVKRPGDFALPAAKELSPVIGQLIQKNQSRFAGVTELTWFPNGRLRRGDYCGRSLPFGSERCRRFPKNKCSGFSRRWRNRPSFGCRTTGWRIQGITCLGKRKGPRIGR